MIDLPVRLQFIRMGKMMAGRSRAHHCPDWDFLFIRPGDPEMDCCLCTLEDEATRQAALYPDERQREVEQC